MAIELIVQHIRDFLNNRGRSIDTGVHPIIFSDGIDDKNGDENSSSSVTPPIHGKKKTDTHSHNMHRPH